MNVSLQQKIIGGFAFNAVVCVIVGIIGWYGANVIKAKLENTGDVKIPTVQAILNLKGVQAEVKASIRTLLNPSIEFENKKLEYAVIEKSFSKAEEIIKVYEGMPRKVDEDQRWQEFRANWQVWKKDTDKCLSLSYAIDAVNIENPQKLAMDAENSFGTYKTWAANASKAILERQVAQDVARKIEDLEFGQWLKSLNVSNEEVQKAKKQLEFDLEEVFRSVSTIMDYIEIEEFDLAKDVYIGEVLPSIESIQMSVDNMMEQIHKAMNLYGQLDKHERESTAVSLAKTEQILNQIVEATNQSVTHHVNEGNASANKVTASIILAVLFGSIFAMGLGIFLSRGIANPINLVVMGLSDSATQVTSASAQISSASNSLSEGATDQAASQEESSATLQEITAMTSRDASNARQADTLMKEAGKVISSADSSMNELVAAMTEISRASDETFKIVKTIDEIAFQTNLLALNAAVEAARAGEAGAGFAVVADEVRNLAMRAAEAAKNTSDLIEGTTKKIKEGVEIATRTNDAFVHVAESAGKVQGLVSEIAESSNEQAEAVGQVNQATNEISNVTQRNASSAEEAAAASEELSAQASVMEEMVEELAAIVSGKLNSASDRQNAQSGFHAGQQSNNQLLPESTTVRKNKGPLGDTHQTEDFENF